MRGNEGLTATRPYTGPDKPSSQPQPHSVGYKHSSRHDRATSGGRVDISALSDPSVIKQKRVSSTPKSDAYISYKRFIQYEMLKDSKTEEISRRMKTKPVKPKSEKITDEMQTSQYICVTSYSKLPKRSKTSRKENSDKTGEANISKTHEDRPSLGRRSRTFIVDSQNGFLDSLETLHKKIKSRHLAQSNINSSNNPDSKETQRHGDVSKRTGTPKEVTSSVETQSEERREHDGRRFHQWETERECGREGARNPMTEGTLPARPKSAGQLRYCDTLDDSDESSLDGEIEIVDIDKELENNPEPSPYWSQTQPLQVPEVFVQTNSSTNPPPWSNTATDSGRSNLQAPQHLSPSPHTTHPPAQPQRPARVGKQRHGSGESDLSAFSDTMVKPTPPHERRRFLSEPEILTAEDRTVGGRSNGKTKKGRRLLEESRVDVNDVTFPTTSSGVVPRRRERLYSDTMERVISRYSELGLRDVPEDINSKGRASRPPVGHHLSATSCHMPNSTGTREAASGHLIPPRKLKPILKPPKNETNTGPTS